MWSRGGYLMTCTLMQALGAAGVNSTQLDSATQSTHIIIMTHEAVAGGVARGASSFPRGIADGHSQHGFGCQLVACEVATGARV